MPQHVGNQSSNHSLSSQATWSWSGGSLYASASSSASGGSSGPPPGGLGIRGGSVGFSVGSHHTYVVATQHSNGTRAIVVTPSSTQSQGIYVV